MIFIGRNHDFCCLQTEQVGQIRNCEVRSVNTLVTVEETVDDKVSGLDRIVDASRYSSLKSLLMVTCFVVRFKNNLLAKLRKKDFIK